MKELRTCIFVGFFLWGLMMMGCSQTEAPVAPEGNLDLHGVILEKSLSENCGGGFTVFVSADFSETEDIVGFGWEIGSQVTLTIDKNADNIIDFQRTTTVDDKGEARFQDYTGGPSPFDVTEGSIVRMFNDCNMKTHVVNYITLEVVYQAADLLSGSARQGTVLYARVFNPSLPFPQGDDIIVTADATQIWSARFAEIVDIGPGSAGWVQTNDDDGDHTQINWEIPSETIEVLLDIKPGHYPNSINPTNKGVIPVAILTTEDFDATTVNPLSVKFGPNGASTSHDCGHIEDVDGDNDLDLVLHFKTENTGIQCGDTASSLIGETLDGQAIEGSDSINTVGCK